MGKTFVVPLWIGGRATHESSVVEPSYLGEATGAMGERKTLAVERFDLGAVCNPALIDAWLFVFYRCCICSGFGLVYG